MKLVVLADIHGNGDALRAVLPKPAGGSRRQFAPQAVMV
jgi:hypothetical protein